MVGLFLVGTLVSRDYNSASLGFGRDLMMLGAISLIRLILGNLR